MRRALIRKARRWLYIGHRWIGIVTCLLFAMWFISGLVMMYVAFPGLSEQERLAALPRLAWEKVKLSPDRAMALAGAVSYPREFRLNVLDGAPVYRLLDWDGRRQIISAVDGRIVDGIAPEQALAVARGHPAAMDVQLIDTVERDQWSVVARFDPLRPLYLVALGDAAGTQLYVSARTGEIVLDTSRTERVWNWLGSIPHWIYPTVLRRDGALWRSVVLWISGICMIVAISGIWIGILRVRLRRRYNGGAITPYSGWMKWHHVTGVFSGVFVLTWIFSGWMSLDPGRLFDTGSVSRDMLQRYAGHDSPSFAGMLPEKPQVAAVEARFGWLGGVPLMLLADRMGVQTVVDPSTGVVAPLSEKAIFEAARALMPQAAMPLQLRLDRYDSYWYAHHQQQALPVLRVGFDDDAQSWFHIDPNSGTILNRIDSRRRSYRWIFNALHSMDFPWLLAYRPTWDAVVWVLSLLGLTISVSGVVIGWRYLRK